MERLAAVVQVATAYFTRNPTRLDEIEQVIERVERALAKVGCEGDEVGSEPTAPPASPAAGDPVALLAAGGPAKVGGIASDSEVSVVAPAAAPAVTEVNVEAGKDVQEQEVLKPAVPIEESITDEFLICLEDGRKFQTLKRHLKAVYKMTPLQYIRRWGLPPNYPMVSPAYSRMRSRVAKEGGLGLRHRDRPDGEDEG